MPRQKTGSRFKYQSSQRSISPASATRRLPATGIEALGYLLPSPQHGTGYCVNGSPVAQEESFPSSQVVPWSISFAQQSFSQLAKACPFKTSASVFVLVLRV